MRVGTPGFVAGRLTEAREARGLTQTELAELTGIKPQSISHYEQGRQSPSPEALELLCAQLSVPLRLFLRPVSGYATENIFFHGDRTNRLREARRLSWFKEIAACVARSVSLPDVLLHRVTAPVDIDSVADEVRSIVQDSSTPIRDMPGCLERLGCMVSYGASSLSQWDAGVPWVFLNTADDRSSWVRFRAAHELGHLTLNSAVEADADRFARAFLLPRQAFGDDVWAPTLDALLTIKKEWKCPIGVMIARCGEIGRFDANQVKRAMVNLARRGWNAQEPREAQVTIERPTFLARSIRLSGRSVAAEVALNPADIEELVGLPEGYFAGELRDFGDGVSGGPVIYR